LTDTALKPIYCYLLVLRVSDGPEAERLLYLNETLTIINS